MSTKKKGRRTTAVSRTNAAIGNHVAEGIETIVSEGGSREFQRARARTVGRRMARLIRESLSRNNNSNNNNNT
jgi:hypothetical protein